MPTGLGRPCQASRSSRSTSSTCGSTRERPVASSSSVLRQHLIDPAICIRCNTCEETCPVDAITHDSRNYVVDASICNGCNACISPCPTGSIDNWRTVDASSPYTLEEQLIWDELPSPTM